MPIYEYQCVKNPEHIFEKFYKLEDSDRKYVQCSICFSIKCKEHGVENPTDANISLRSMIYVRTPLAERIWSIPGNISIGKPTRVFIDQRTGQTFTPTSEYEKAPRGCREIELKNPIERSKFEHEQQTITDAKNEVISHSLNSMREEATRKRHDDLKARMNTIQRDIDPISGEEVRYSLDEKSKDLLKKSMNRSNQKKEKIKKSDVMLAINHTDRSNLTEVK
jgi:hypothetical protein